MAWFINAHRIYVEKDTGWQCQPRIGEIDVLDSIKTIIHTAGRPSYRRNITAVVFSGYAANILPLANGSGYPLLSDQGNEGNVVIKNLKGERLFDTSRTTPVIRFTMELIKDDS